MVPERLSIELSQRCGKACWFCYNGSGPVDGPAWAVDEVVGFVRDCAAHGTRAVSFGGGEPLEYDGLFAVLDALRGTCFRSFTTNGLHLDARWDEVVAAAPDKVHVSVHFPGHRAEVDRVARQVAALQEAGVRSGVNLLVARSQLVAATAARATLAAAGVTPDRLVLLPSRGHDTPSPQEMSRVAGDGRFQSVSCLAACGRSPRFASLSADRRAAWCSYTTERRPLPEPTARGLDAALSGLGLVFCGGRDDRPARLPRRPQHGHDVVRGGP